MNIIKMLVLLLCLFFSTVTSADNQVWTDLNPEHVFVTPHTLPGKTHSARLLSLNTALLEQRLNPSLRTERTASRSVPESLILPLPDGGDMEFYVEKSAVLPLELASRYPTIQTWTIRSAEHPGLTGKIDLGPNGFHAMFDTSGGDKVFIDPDHASPGTYLSLSRKDQQYTTSRTFSCGLDHSDGSLFSHNAGSAHEHAERPQMSARLAEQSIIYRLALAATGEYTQFFGGRKENALAAMTTTINRVNQVFERDLGITLQLVAENDQLIYLDGSKDPYSNEDAFAMVDENVVNLNEMLDADSYDIGHVFGTDNTGGLAFLKSACGQYKGGGATGSISPKDDAFSIDYVSHEIGHQLGASHTFNGQHSNCSGSNRFAGTAVEPGSGSTIMSYAGICGEDNLQRNSDAFFHSVSINEIVAYTRSGDGAKCGIREQSTNSAPDVSAGDDQYIPANTPFMLSGMVSDVDADALEHSWEQIDTGSIAGLKEDTGSNPLFRTWLPSEHSSRYFPRLTDLMNDTKTIGEHLPTLDRQLNFNLVTRDGKGGVGQDSTMLNVINTGNSFEVTSQAQATFMTAGQATSVSWEVAGTDQPPINCSAVDINILEISGNHQTLIRNTPNDGSESFLIPNNIIDTKDSSRVQVKCSTRPFFAVSKGQIELVGGISNTGPTLSISSPTLNEGDSGTQNLIFNLSLSSGTSQHIVLDYTLTEQSNDTRLQQGQALILAGDTNTEISLPVKGNTTSNDNRIIVLTISNPQGIMLSNGQGIMSVVGTVIDDDAVAANPDTRSEDTFGGGSWGAGTVLSLLLLVLYRRNIRKLQ